MRLGGAMGAVSYSKDQESEADHLAAIILQRSGYDLERANTGSGGGFLGCFQPH